ncbi:hypothetical protein QM012_002821 [Aureobasidium pullulans]|uniref:Uncharacterized protein n=1 Tax=Aureobasidium pullulans TaxID=5580 RepID=A0ABR0TC24_AURPU
MPHPLRTNRRVILEWMKAMNTGLSGHRLTTPRPAVMTLWQQYGSGSAWSREQVDWCLAESGPDLRSPVLTTEWRRQRNLPALAEAYPRGDWEACADAIWADMQAERAAAAAAAQQTGSETAQPPPVSGQSGAAAAAAAAAAAEDKPADKDEKEAAPAAEGKPAEKNQGKGSKEDKKEGATKEVDLGRYAPVGNVGDLPTTAPPTAPPPFLSGFEMRPGETAGSDLRSCFEISSSGSCAGRPTTQQPVGKSRSSSTAMAEAEALQQEVYEEDLAKMEDSGEDEWTTEEVSVVDSEENLTLAELLQREADLELQRRQREHQTRSPPRTSAHGALPFRPGGSIRSPRRDRSRSPRR